eukprot:TRINITY_DN8353_c0_g1_i4.p1 TRINITY_DN8353_c0_g1~~TRINITY_DN8353_c0_g1_i4.p1  ORF type:complete len:628 (-),score=83.50 TRINITY_DN8353_c0_g1_i4:85-1788(-)
MAEGVVESDKETIDNDLDSIPALRRYLQRELVSLGDRIENVIRSEVAKVRNDVNRIASNVNATTTQELQIGSSILNERYRGAISMRNAPFDRHAGSQRMSMLQSASANIIEREGRVHHPCVSSSEGAMPVRCEYSHLSRVEDDVIAECSDEELKCDTGQDQHSGGASASPSSLLRTMLDPKTRERRSSRLQRFISNEYFDMGVMIAVFCSAVVVGIDADINARTMGKSPLILRFIDSMLCTLFVVELVLRVVAKDWSYFHDRAWALFHWLIVAVQVVEELNNVCNFSPKLGDTLYTLRPVRIARVFRLLEVSTATTEIRILLVSIKSSIRSLGCSLLVLLVFTYTCSVPLTMNVTAYHLQYPHDEQGRQALNKYFGTLDRSMLSLFQSITEGVHWELLLDPIMEYLSPWCAAGFIFYIGFSVFALMNILTGVFVESAMKTAEEDKRRGLGRKMRLLFEEADIDGNGTVSHEEFSACVSTNQLMKAYLSALDIREEQALELFRLLDEDDSGEVDYDEFTQGCIKLQGPVKAIDFAAFMVEWRMLNVFLTTSDTWSPEEHEKESDKKDV